MTSLISPEERIERNLIPLRTALSKLAPHQTEQILLIFGMAAQIKFGAENPSAQITERLGREEAAKLTLDEFLAEVDAEIPLEAKAPKKLRIHRTL